MKKRIAAICAAALLAGLLLSGCAPKITEGEVIEKRFEPEDWGVRTIPVTTYSGGQSHLTMVPQTYYVPDRWYIVIQQYSEEEGKMLTATYRVTEDVYDTVEIGEQFVYDKESNTTE